MERSRAWRRSGVRRKPRMTKRGWAQETRRISGRGAGKRRRDERQDKPKHERQARWRGYSRGQSIIIFALTLTVLLGFAGLAIDVARIYDLYARMQRAAEAGVLAGVLYMPNNYNTGLPSPGDGFTAISRASQETVKNGFGTALPPTTTGATACPTPFTATEVSVCPVAGKPNDLRVAITETTPLALLSALGLR